MFLSFLVTAVLSISVARAVNVDKESCERPNPWAPRTRAGMEWSRQFKGVEWNPETSYFCEAGYIDGNVLTGIRMWRTDWAVMGIQFQWGELEWGRVYGTDLLNFDEADAKKQSVRKADNEVVWTSADKVQLDMKQNEGKGDEGLNAVGWIKVTINDSVKMDNGSAHKTGDWLPIDNGAGKIVALQGKAPNVANTADLAGPLHTLEFVFLESPIKSSSMTDIKFTEDINAWNSLQKGMDLNASIAETWYVNDNPKGGTNQTFSNALDAKITHSQRLETTRTTGFGVTIGAKTTVKTKIPFLAEGKVDTSIDLKFEVTQSDMNGTTDEKTISFSFTQGAQFITGVPPQSATNCTVTAHEGRFISDYLATISTTLTNGKAFLFYERGVLTTVNFVNAISRCQTMPLSEMPQVVNGETIKGSNVKRTVADQDVKASLLKRAVAFFA